jgi:type II restriction enzyme
MYEKFEEHLSHLHPDNRHVRDKIRQQLQVLRNRGLIEFVKPGVYRRIDSAGSTF